MMVAPLQRVMAAIALIAHVAAAASPTPIPTYRATNMPPATITTQPDLFNTSSWNQFGGSSRHLFSSSFRGIEQSGCHLIQIDAIVPVVDRYIGDLDQYDGVYGSAAVMDPFMNVYLVQHLTYNNTFQFGAFLFIPEWVSGAPVLIEELDSPMGSPALSPDASILYYQRREPYSSLSNDTASTLRAVSLLGTTSSQTSYILWEFSFMPLLSGIVVSPDGNRIFASSATNVYCFSSNGTMLWSNPVVLQTETTNELKLRLSPPSLSSDGGTLYVTQMGRSLVGSASMYELDAQLGFATYEVVASEGFLGPPLVINDGTICAASLGSVFCATSDSLASTWDVGTGVTGLYSSNAVYCRSPSGPMLAIGDTGGSVYVYDYVQRTLLWTAQVRGGGAILGLSADRDCTLYATTENFALVSITQRESATIGSTTVELSLVGGAISAPFFAPDRTFVIGTDSLGVQSLYTLGSRCPPGVGRIACSCSSIAGRLLVILFLGAVALVMLIVAVAFVGRMIQQRAQNALERQPILKAEKLAQDAEDKLNDEL